MAEHDSVIETGDKGALSEGAPAGSRRVPAVAKAGAWWITTLVVLLGMVSIVLVGAHHSRKRAVRGPSAAARPGAAGAIERGLSYLRRNRSDLSAAIVLDYLQRRYALPSDLAFARLHAALATDARLRVWGRLVGKDQLRDPTALGAWGDQLSIDDVVMRALYCDRFQLPADYAEALQRFVGRGGYELTHAALALRLLHDNGCTLASGDVRSLGEQARASMVILLSQTPPDRRFEELDVRYEALAFLQDFLSEGNLQEGQFDRLLAEQQPDGGWRPQSDRPSGPHPTVLALWALLARAQAGAPGMAFARSSAHGGASRAAK
jgi:hypothetical protein